MWWRWISNLFKHYFWLKLNKVLILNKICSNHVPQYSSHIWHSVNILVARKTNGRIHWVPLKICLLGLIIPRSHLPWTACMYCTISFEPKRLWPKQFYEWDYLCFQFSNVFRIHWLSIIDKDSILHMASLKTVLNSTDLLEICQDPTNWPSDN